MQSIYFSISLELAAVCVWKPVLGLFTLKPKVIIINSFCLNYDFIKIFSIWSCSHVAPLPEKLVSHKHTHTYIHFHQSKKAQSFFYENNFFKKLYLVDWLSSAGEMLVDVEYFIWEVTIKYTTMQKLLGFWECVWNTKCQCWYFSSHLPYFHHPFGEYAGKQVLCCSYTSTWKRFVSWAPARPAFIMDTALKPCSPSQWLIFTWEPLQGTVTNWFNWISQLPVIPLIMRYWYCDCRHQPEEFRRNSLVCGGDKMWWGLIAYHPLGMIKQSNEWFLSHLHCKHDYLMR